MSLFSKTLDQCSNVFKTIGAVAVTAMMILTVVDVIGRFFKHPIFGAIELVGFLAAIVVAAALPYTHKLDGHVGVEIVVRLLPRKVQLIIEIITQTLSLFLFSLITWQMFVYGQELNRTGEVSMNLQFPVHYLVYLIAFGLAVFTVTVLEIIIENINQLRELKTK